MISQTVQKLSRWQTNKQTDTHAHKQTLLKATPPSLHCRCTDSANSAKAAAVVSEHTSCGMPYAIRPLKCHPLVSDNAMCSEKNTHFCFLA